MRAFWIVWNVAWIAWTAFWLADAIDSGQAVAAAVQAALLVLFAACFAYWAFIHDPD